MVGNRGFIYIVEVVLVSVVLIVSMGFLLGPLDLEEDWEYVELEKIGESILSSANREQKVEESVFRKTPHLTDRIDDIIYSTGGRMNLRYSLKAENLYPWKINVGFNCTDGGCTNGDPVEERITIQQTLDKVWMNNRYIDLEVLRIDLEEFEGDGQEAGKMDVFIARGEEQVTGVDENSGAFKTFVENGGGIVQFSDFDTVENLGIQESIFGIQHAPEENDLSSFEFINREDPKKPNYEPSKLFYGVGSSVVTEYPTGDLTKRVGELDLGGFSRYDVTVDKDKKVNITHEGDIICELCEEGDSFEAAGEEISIRKIEKRGYGVNRDNVIVHFDNPRDHTFTSFGDLKSTAKSTEDESLNVLEGDDNYIMVLNRVGNGKAVWLTETETGMNDEMRNDIKSLLRAGVIWAGPRGEWLKREDRHPRSSFSRTSHFGSFNKDMYEPYKIVMETWYTY